MKYLNLLFIVFSIFHLNAQDLSQKLSNQKYNEMVWVASGGENPICGYSNFVIKPTLFYVVVDVKNLNTDTTKQMAILYQDLRSAVNMDRESVFHREQRTVELKSELALERIGFDKYDLDELKKIQANMDLNDFYNKAKEEESREEVLRGVNASNQKYYAHLLFNFGALSGYNARSNAYLVYDKRATELLKNELMDRLLPSDYEPDTKIGDIHLLNDEHVQSYFGKESIEYLERIKKKETQTTQFTLLTNNTKEKITLHSLPNESKLVFSFFRIEKAVDSDQAFTSSKVDKFVTENGVRLGMTEEEFVEVKGKPSVLANLGQNKKEYNYCIVEMYNHELLKQYKLPGYFANYTFEEGVLTAFEFGFVRH
jgi:hypothetical protein